METSVYYYYHAPSEFDLKELDVIRKQYFDESISYDDICHYANDSRYVIRILKNEQREVVGYLFGIKSLDEFELYQIAVKKQYLKSKIGTYLFEQFLKECNKLLIKSIFLEVDVNNINAINFYEKLGFKKLFLRKQYYSNGDDCYVYKIEVKDAYDR